ncbi:MAG: hypothetical protein WKG52_16110 [Variovorax sp.]
MRITGENGTAYRLGEPMHVYDAEHLLGVIDPVRVSRDGSEVRIERFVPSRHVKTGKRNFGPLVLLEVTLYLATHFRGVQMVSFSLNREIEMHGDGMQVAVARSELLHGIGAESITISPRPDSSIPGNFVVEGEWAYNPANLAALEECLLRERSGYRARAPDSTGLPAPLRWLRRLMRGAGR